MTDGEIDALAHIFAEEEADPDSYTHRCLEQMRRGNSLLTAIIALRGDLAAEDGYPTHFSSWFVLDDAIKAYGGKP